MRDLKVNLNSTTQRHALDFSLSYESVRDMTSLSTDQLQDKGLDTAMRLTLHWRSVHQ